MWIRHGITRNEPEHVYHGERAWLKRTREPSTGSTDMGDVTRIVPGVHPMIGGFEGTPHTPEEYLALVRGMRKSVTGEYLST